MKPSTARRSNEASVLIEDVDEAAGLESLAVGLHG